MSAVSPDIILNQAAPALCDQEVRSYAEDRTRTVGQARQVAALVLSSYGLQPWKFIVITDSAMRKKLHPVSFNQAQTLDASHLVVFAARTHRRRPTWIGT